MQICQRDVTNQVLVVVADILLLDGVELEQCSILNIRVAEVYAYQNIVGVLHGCVVEHSLVLVAVVVEAGGNIAQHSRACWMTSRATTKHKLLVVEFSLDNYAIELILNRVDILLTRNELRHHAHNYFAVLQLLDMGNQLVATLLLVCKADVVVVHRGDAVGKYLIGRNIATEGVYGDDNQLEQRVPTANVECRVALGKAQLLRTTKCYIVGVVLVKNLRQDEV